MILNLLITQIKPYISVYFLINIEIKFDKFPRSEKYKSIICGVAKQITDIITKNNIRLWKTPIEISSKEGQQIQGYSSGYLHQNIEK